MSSTTIQWKHLEPRPKSAYRQLFVRGTRIRAEVIYWMHVNDDEPMHPEAIAVEYGLPVEAVLEAIAYCDSKPGEIEEDRQREESLMQATGMNDPSYKSSPIPHVISAQERARILGA
jgi:uncharacterized protein (DUF433 family)